MSCALPTCWGLVGGLLPLRLLHSSLSLCLCCSGKAFVWQDPTIPSNPRCPLKRVLWLGLVLQQSLWSACYPPELYLQTKESYLKIHSTCMHSSTRFINSHTGWLANLFQSKRYSIFFLAWYRKCSVSKRPKKYLCDAICKWYFEKMRCKAEIQTLGEFHHLSLVSF